MSRTILIALLLFAFLGVLGVLVVNSYGENRMAQLKPGKLADFADSMAEAMEKAMEQEWQAFKGQALPDAGKDERRILFTSVSIGLLNYLKQHQNEIINAITLESTGVTNVTALDLNVPE